MARILHIVTEVSPAYGGPGTVATQHARGLARRGHEVTLVSTGLGVAGVDHVSLDGYAHVTFPARRTRLPVKRVTNGPFAICVSAELDQWLHRRARSFDVAHVHFGREMLLLRATRQLQRAGVPTVLQPHGMVEPAGLIRSVVDALAVRNLLQRATVVLALQPHEESRLRMVAPAVSVMQVPNCVDRDDFAELPDERYARRPYVAFVGRLHPKKRVLSFIAMAVQLADRFPHLQFRVIGADGGDLAEATRQVNAADLEDRIHFDGPRSRAQAVQAVRDAEVFVLPSASEAFPMSVLEAFVMRTPAVVAEGIQIARLLSEHEAARITNGSVDSLVGAVSELLTRPDVAGGQVARACRLVHDHLSMDGVIDKLEFAYGIRDLVGRP